MSTFSSDVDRATSYCTYCPKMCRFSCPAAQAEDRETVTPWGMMRLFEKVKTGDVEGSEDVADIFYHCTGCRRCGEWCEHDNDVPEALWSARSWMRDLGHTPSVLEDFPSRFFENRSPHDDLPALDGESTPLETVYDDGSPLLYMPDCTTRRREPDRIADIGRLLEIVSETRPTLYTRRDGNGAGCCGFPLLAAGDERGWEGHVADLQRAFADADTIVVQCAASVATTREGTSWEAPGSSEPVHLLEFLLEHIDEPPPSPIPADEMMLHDSCLPGRQIGLHADVRELTGWLCEGDVGEFEYARDEAPCCGARGHYPTIAPDAAAECAERRLEDLDREGGQRLLCTSPRCKDAFREVADDPDRIIDLTDLALAAYELNP